MRRDVVVWSWVFFLYLFLAAPDVRGQPSQAEGGHASHHGGADPTGPSEGSADGASSEELAADRRGGMRGAQPTPLFSQMLDAEGATPVGRARIRDRAERLMLAGAQEMSAGIAEMNAATSSDDQFAMRKAALRLHQGAQQLEAGLVALDALSQAAVPREAAMRWFQENLGLRSPVPSDRPAGTLGVSTFHGFAMVVLVVSLGALLWMNARRSRRAGLLAERLASSGPPDAPVAPAPVDRPELVREPGSVPAVPPEERPSKSNSWTGLLRVGRIFEETSSVRTLRLVEPGGGEIPFRYLPGQFLTVAVRVHDDALKRSYTIASSPTRRDYCEVTVKREDRGTVSSFLHHVHEGDTLQVTAPSGAFTFIGDDANSVVLISGGVGITPMMSILRFLTDRCWLGDIFFLHGCRSDADLIFAEELAYLAKRYSNVHVRVAAAEVTAAGWPYSTGFITRELLVEWVPHIQNRRIHLCGPKPMLESMKATLAALEVPEKHVRTEIFIGREQPSSRRPAAADALADVDAVPVGAEPAAAGAGHSPSQPEAAVAVVSFVRSRRTALLPPTKSILEASEDVGVNIDYSCRVGVCGVCKVRLLAGSVSMAVEDGLSNADRRDGYVLACQAKASGDVSVDA